MGGRVRMPLILIARGDRLYCPRNESDIGKIHYGWVVYVGREPESAALCRCVSSRLLHIDWGQ